MSNDAATATSSEEISPQDAWQMLQEDPRVQLVDVRTEPEWIYVGMPGLLMLAQADASHAQTFPDRAVRFIVPNPAGGSNDLAAIK
jgi:rhodanese-related sulfurtransferase